MNIVCPGDDGLDTRHDRRHLDAFLCSKAQELDLVPEVICAGHGGHGEGEGFIGPSVHVHVALIVVYAHNLVVHAVHHHLLSAGVSSFREEGFVDFFADDARVGKEAEALDKEDIKTFLDLVNESGRSSETLLQNLYSPANPKTQGIPLALLLSRKVLGKEGACRVHGGGFAGTIQAFVPKDKVREYTEALEGAFGKGACHILRIRPKGAVQII